jgi:hypothetical protein
MRDMAKKVAAGVPGAVFWPAAVAEEGMDIDDHPHTSSQAARADDDDTFGDLGQTATSSGPIEYNHAISYALGKWCLF